MAVASATEAAYRECRGWFLARGWAEGDRQIEADMRAGKLDFLVREGLEAKKQGKFAEL